MTNKQFLIENNLLGEIFDNEIDIDYFKLYAHDDVYLSSWNLIWYDIKDDKFEWQYGTPKPKLLNLIELEVDALTIRREDDVFISTLTINNRFVMHDKGVEVGLFSNARFYLKEYDCINRKSIFEFVTNTDSVQVSDLMLFNRDIKTIVVDRLTSGYLGDKENINAL